MTVPIFHQPHFNDTSFHPAVNTSEALAAAAGRQSPAPPLTQCSTSGASQDTGQKVLRHCKKLSLQKFSGISRVLLPQHQGTRSNSFSAFGNQPGKLWGQPSHISLGTHLPTLPHSQRPSSSPTAAAQLCSVQALRPYNIEGGTQVCCPWFLLEIKLITKPNCRQYLKHYFQKSFILLVPFQVD